LDDLEDWTYSHDTTQQKYGDISFTDMALGKTSKESKGAVPFHQAAKINQVGRTTSLESPNQSNDIYDSGAYTNYLATTASKYLKAIVTLQNRIKSTLHRFKQQPHSNYCHRLQRVLHSLKQLKKFLDFFAAKNKKAKKTVHSQNGK